MSLLQWRWHSRADRENCALLKYSPPISNMRYAYWVRGWVLFFLGIWCFTLHMWVGRVQGGVRTSVMSSRTQVSRAKEGSLLQKQEHRQSWEQGCNSPAVSAQVWQHFGLNSERPCQRLSDNAPLQLGISTGQGHSQKAFWVQAHCLEGKAIYLTL